jgi:hypothetical protein
LVGVLSGFGGRLGVCLIGEFGVGVGGTGDFVLGRIVGTVGTIRVGCSRGVGFWSCESMAFLEDFLSVPGVTGRCGEASWDCPDTSGAFLEDFPSTLGVIGGCDGGP